MPNKSFSAVLLDYTDIQTAWPKWRRKERHQALQNWLAKPYDLPDYDELTHFISWCGERNIPLNVVFQRKLVNPVFDAEIFERRNAQAIKTILLHFSGSEFLDFKGDYSISLLNMALAQLPDDLELLEHKWEKMRHYHDFTIHEVPWGVLWDMVNGARLEQMDEMESEIAEFEALSKRLGHDWGNLVAACRNSYALWRLYLNDKRKYESFADCIRRNRTMLSEEAIYYIWGNDGCPFSDD